MATVATCVTITKREIYQESGVIRSLKKESTPKGSHVRDGMIT